MKVDLAAAAGGGGIEKRKVEKTVAKDDDVVWKGCGIPIIFISPKIRILCIFLITGSCTSLNYRMLS